MAWLRLDLVFTVVVLMVRQSMPSMRTNLVSLAVAIENRSGPQGLCTTGTVSEDKLSLGCAVG